MEGVGAGPLISLSTPVLNPQVTIYNPTQHTESHVNPLHTVHASDSPELVRELLVPMEI